MTQQTNNTAADKILPANATNAVQKLIQLSQSLINLTERETQALLQNDLLAFSVLQDEKEAIAKIYTKASEEFRARLHDFRAADKALLNKLGELQDRLGEKMNDNNNFMERIKVRAQKNTSKTLFTVQELAHQKPVRFDNAVQTQQGA